MVSTERAEPPFPETGTLAPTGALPSRSVGPELHGQRGRQHDGYEGVVTREGTQLTDCMRRRMLREVIWGRFGAARKPLDETQEEWSEDQVLDSDVDRQFVVLLLSPLLGMIAPVLAKYCQDNAVDDVTRVGLCRSFASPTKGADYRPALIRPFMLDAV